MDATGGMSDSDSAALSPSATDYDTGLGSSRQEIEDDLRDSGTSIVDIDALLEWLSLRKQGSRETKILKILGVFDTHPNVVRLARDCYFREDHRDKLLLENIAIGNKKLHFFNSDGVLTEDLGYDEESGRYSRADVLPGTAAGGGAIANPPAGSPSEEPADESAADAGLGMPTPDAFRALQRRLAAVESARRDLSRGGGGMSEDAVKALIAQSKKEARAELLSDIRDGREVVWYLRTYCKYILFMILFHIMFHISLNLPKPTLLL